MDPASIASNANLVNTGNNKTKKRGRGRPPSFHYATAPSVASSNLPVASSESLERPPTEDTDPTGTSAMDSSAADVAQEPSQEQESGNIIEQDVSMDVDGDNEDHSAEADSKIDVKPDPEDSKGATDKPEEANDAPTVETEGSKEPIKIPFSHPLMGLWVGNFSVKNAKGTEDLISETMFLYTTMGADIKPEFKDLPPEPQFPFCLMKGQPLPVVQTSTVPSAPASATKTSESAFGVPDIAKTTETAAVSFPYHNLVIFLFVCLPVSGELQEVKVEKDSVTQQQDSLASSSMDPQQQDSSGDNNADTAQQQVDHGLTPAAFDSIYRKVLVGFGRNAIGRFSVAAIYDEQTGELRCEKKYMTVKFAIKRGRRSHVEYAMVYPGGLESKASSSGRKYSFDLQQSPAGAGLGGDASLMGGHSSELNVFQTRHRTKSITGGSSSYYQNHYEDDFLYEGYSASGLNGSAQQSHAGSSSGQVGSSSGGGVSGSKKKRTGSIVGGGSSMGGGKSNGSGGNSGGQQLMTEEILHDILRSDANVLLGPRNPDNDLLLLHYGLAGVGNSSNQNHHAVLVNSAAAMIDPETGILYREAFMDVDTGEIYEGEWYGGYRTGRGIVVYADGLMYEGQWLRGREHGKGELMTGDRQLIYSGDWMDGVFHGFGVYYFPNGDVYTGDWKEGNRHGRGDYYYHTVVTSRYPKSSNSSSSSSSQSKPAQSSSNQQNQVPTGEEDTSTRYIGDWRDNKRHGKGKFIWSDGSYYEGDWENDLKHGRGVLELSNGFKYDGSWVRNVMEGKGICYFPSGQCYQGTFKSGLRDGRGSVTFAEGAVYEGRFKEDRFDGQGTLKILKVISGNDSEEILIPIQIQSDLWRIHWKAGFGANLH